MVNTVDKEKKVGHVLSGIGATAYSMLQNLLVPTIPKGGDLATQGRRNRSSCSGFGRTSFFSR